MMRSWSSLVVSVLFVPVGALAQTRPPPRPPLRRSLRPPARPPPPTEASVPLVSEEAPSLPTPAEPEATPSPAPPASPARLQPPPAPAALPVADDPLRARPVVFDGFVGLRGFGRNLYFTDDFFQRLRPYTLSFAPALAVSFEWYPGAHFTRAAISSFALVACGEYGFGFASVDAQGRRYDTEAWGVSVGLRVRRTFWRVEVGFTLAYGHQVFALDRTSAGEAPPEGIPNVAYQSVRAGFSGRINLHRRLALTVGFTWLTVLSAGEIDGPDYFPRSFVGGFEVHLGVAVPLVRDLEARFAVDWRRYFHHMNVVPGDRLVAGGAADDFPAATLGIAWRPR